MFAYMPIDEILVVRLFLSSQQVAQISWCLPYAIPQWKLKEIEGKGVWGYPSFDVVCGNVGPNTCRVTRIGTLQ